MAPTIVLHDGKPFLAVGSPGGSTIITTVLQILLIDRIDFGMTLPQAIAAPRAVAAQRVDDDRRAGVHLVAAGGAACRRAATRSSNGGEIGAATGIEFLPGGSVLAAAEPVRRGGGSAMVEHPLAARPRDSPRAAPAGLSLRTSRDVKRARPCRTREDGAGVALRLQHRERAGSSIRAAGRDVLADHGLLGVDGRLEPVDPTR